MEIMQNAVHKIFSYLKRTSIFIYFCKTVWMTYDTAK